MTPSMLTANPTALKWPFSYAGVKRELLPVILPILRRFDAEAYVMPFLGGGAVELAMAGRGYTCYAADADAELVNVWHSISAAPAALAYVNRRLPEVRQLYAGYKFRKVQVKYRLAVATRGGYTGGELLVRGGARVTYTMGGSDIRDI